MGEIFVRRDGFSHKWLNKYLAKRGYVVKDSYISEWIFYVDYLLEKQLLEPDSSLRNKIERKIRNTYMRRVEKKIKKILTKTGFYEYKGNHIVEIIENSTHILPLDYKGEPGIVLGATLSHGLSDYAGIINVGPFGCMPTRITEAITLPELTIEEKRKALLNKSSLVNKSSTFEIPEIFNGAIKIPFLTIETDGNVYPQIIEAKLESFLLQAERAAKLIKIAQMVKSKNNNANKVVDVLELVDKIN
jgi:hypothetical protein